MEVLLSCNSWGTRVRPQVSAVYASLNVHCICGQVSPIGRGREGVCRFRRERTVGDPSIYLAYMVALGAGASVKDIFLSLIGGQRSFLALSQMKG